MAKATKMIFFVFIALSTVFLTNLNVEAAGWGFKKNGDNKTPDIGSYGNLIEGTSSYYVGDTSKKEVYLTFDAGYDNGEMPKILDILREKQVRATFFLTGDFVNRFPELCLMLVNDGHIVGNHSYRHRPINKLTKSEIEDDLSLLQDKFYEITKTKMGYYFRPPAGEFDRNSLKIIQELGYKTFFWSIAFKDWQVEQQRGKDYSYNSVIDNLHPGAIILLHSVSKSNREALGMIIDEIRNRGYEFKTVDQL